MMNRTVVLILLALLISACGGSEAGSEDAKDIPQAGQDIETSGDVATDPGQETPLDNGSGAVEIPDVTVEVTQGDTTGLDAGHDTPPVQVKTWMQTFGDDGEDFAFSLLQTGSGYTIAGCSDSWADEQGFLLMSIDWDGVEQWHESYGGGNMECARSVRWTGDHGYILAGYSNAQGSGGKSDFLVVKTDANGKEEWSSFFECDEDAEARSAYPCMDGGYIVAGFFFSVDDLSQNGLVIKIDANGNEKWRSDLGGNGHDYTRDVLQTSDGGFVVVGNTASEGEGAHDVWLVKLDADGNEDWSRTFGGPSNDYGYAVRKADDGGYLIAGASYSFDQDIECDMWLIKTDQEGFEQWSNHYGGNETHEYAFSLYQTADGGVVLAGSRASYDNQTVDALLVKVDAAGAEEWTQVFDGGDADGFYTVKETLDGGFVVGGYTRSWGAGGEDVWIVKTDGTGKVL